MRVPKGANTRLLVFPILQAIEKISLKHQTLNIETTKISSDVSVELGVVYFRY